MDRIKLKDRRRAMTHDVLFEGQVFVITVGYDDLGQPKEVFADPAKGSVMSAFMADCCVVISQLLQRGASADEIGKSLGRVPNPMNGKGATKPASPMGVIVDALRVEALLQRSAESEAQNDA